MKTNQEILRQMKRLYYSKDNEYIDWMGFRITDENYPSYHHIIKVESLKRQNNSIDATISNGAYLGKKSHELLHRIEQYDNELYDIWNKLFLIINKMKSYPTDDIWKIVFDLQEKTLEIDKNNKKTK